VNLFVAGFIGSPPMNFLPGEVDGDVLRLPVVDVPLTDLLKARLGTRKLVIVGLRPEHFEDADLSEPTKEAVTLTVPVDVTEWLGSDLYAYVPFETNPDVAGKLEELDRDLDGEGMRTQLVVALDSESKVRDGDEAKLWFDPNKMMVFDPESGENLTYDQEAVREIDSQNEQNRKASLERARAREGAKAS
jgi:multiple sugar transport system ATP-binding protein